MGVATMGETAAGVPAVSTLAELLRRRIAVLDGAMGTMVQGYGLGEGDYRGERFRETPCDQRGNHDLLNLTRPDLVREIHAGFLAAGGDLVTTNTFNASRISQADYGLAALSFEINREGARIARGVVDAFRGQEPRRPRFAVGSLGPMNKTLSLSPDVNDPGHRAVSFEEVYEAYAEQVRGLLAGGVDALLLETIFDTLNAKAALVAIGDVQRELGRELPVLISVTLADRSGRTLSGQTLESFWTSVAATRPLVVGLNCSLGGEQLRPYVEELSQLADAFTGCHPNAGLPNAFGEYDETPAETARWLGEFAREGWVNLVGGCCGTTPEHIRAIADAVAEISPRVPPAADGLPRYSGLETLTLRPESNFTLIGERTNVTGSRRFARLVREGDFAAALDVALQQVRDGANLLDVNMDDAMLDSEAAMERFLKLVASEPEIARLPIAIDSSRWSVLARGMRCVQGKALVNSISLKEGEADFLDKARQVRRHGAAVVVMAFDEEGQAETAERKVAICERAYRLLTEEVGFPPEDIVFDLNIFAVATGIEAHNRYALAFLEAMPEVKRRCPGVVISGGVSNLSFSFRGHEGVRRAMHAAFLHRAIGAGLDMGIVNAGQLALYGDIDAELLERVEDVLLDRRPDATERLVELAQGLGKEGAGGALRAARDLAWREEPVAERLIYALLHGVVDFIEEDAAEAQRGSGSALAVIEGPLMRGMQIVGDRFGAGEMFLPQVVKSARAMKRAVAYLAPLIEREREARGARESHQGVLVMATVKGDVHDIGKNIVGVVLGCNNYRIVDLGVMVPCETILESAAREGADAIGLSGLITPSLDEMVHVATEMERRGLRLPLLIGGATTSEQHTALRIAPRYGGVTRHVRDASRAVGAVAELLDRERNPAPIAALREKQEALRQRHAGRSLKLLDYERARERRLRLDWNDALPEPAFLGRRLLDDVALQDLVPYIDWTMFFFAWELRGKFPAILDHPRYGPAARDLYENAQALLARIVAERSLRARAVYGFWAAHSDGDDVVLFADRRCRDEVARFPMLRQQRDPGSGRPTRCLADYVAPGVSDRPDTVGAFAVTAGIGAADLAAGFERSGDDYNAIAAKALADRLAEAMAEWLHQRVRREWGYGRDEALSREELIAEKYQGIRPAFGYPACPDHSEKPRLFALLDAPAAGITLSESCVMLPAASVSGLYFANPESSYFTVGKIGRDQVRCYAARKGVSLREAETWLRPNLAYDVEDEDDEGAAQGDSG